MTNDAPRIELRTDVRSIWLVIRVYSGSASAALYHRPRKGKSATGKTVMMAWTHTSDVKSLRLAQNNDGASELWIEKTSFEIASADMQKAADFLGVELPSCNRECEVKTDSEGSAP